jgi:hypothetical protein
VNPVKPTPGWDVLVDAAALFVAALPDFEMVGAAMVRPLPFERDRPRLHMATDHESYAARPARGS